MHIIADIEWIKPSVVGAAWFAQVRGVNVGYVSRTAFEDGRWLSVVMPRAGKELRCYAGSAAQACYFAERYLACHMPDVEALAKARKAQQTASGPPLPRKPKGLEDRS